jgi:hypothetical protein
MSKRQYHNKRVEFFERWLPHIISIGITILIAYLFFVFVANRGITTQQCKELIKQELKDEVKDTVSKETMSEYCKRYGVSYEMYWEEVESKNLMYYSPRELYVLFKNGEITRDELRYSLESMNQTIALSIKRMDEIEKKGR